jgi:hypothetical protein
MMNVPAALHHPSSLETARFPGGSFLLSGQLDVSRPSTSLLGR